MEYENEKPEITTPAIGKPPFIIQIPSEDDLFKQKEALTVHHGAPWHTSTDAAQGNPPAGKPRNITLQNA